jgi:hypothetical protein
MLNKYVLILLTNTFFMLNGSVEAEVNNYIVRNNEYKLTQVIDDFFAEHPNVKRVFWSPKVKGKSRYSFSIPRDGHKIASKYADASDLFYLSKQIDSGLKFQPNKSKNIDIIIAENNSNLILSQIISPDIKVGLFLKYKENTSFGLNLNKDVIISKNTLVNFGVEQAKNEHTVFNAKFVKLSDNENSEFYGNIDHEFKSDYLNVGVGNTWFDIANQFDLTLGINELGRKVESEFYATFGEENIKFQIGFDQLKNNSNMNLFFNFKFDNILNKKNFGSNIIITSKESIFGLKKLSLKSFRKKNLDKLWKKNLNYN